MLRELGRHEHKGHRGDHGAKPPDRAPEANHAAEDERHHGRDHHAVGCHHDSGKQIHAQPHSGVHGDDPVAAGYRSLAASASGSESVFMALDLPPESGSGSYP